MSLTGSTRLRVHNHLLKESLVVLQIEELQPLGQRRSVPQWRNASPDDLLRLAELEQRREETAKAWEEAVDKAFKNNNRDNNNEKPNCGTPHHPPRSP